MERFNNDTPCGKKLFLRFITAVFMVFFLFISFTLTASAATYVVKKGDTLYWISRHYSVSVKNIQQANGLKNDLIYPGQKLLIPAGTQTTSNPNYRSATAQAQQQNLSSRGSINEVGDNISSIATSLLGSPYSYGSSGPNSFDCSGFTSYVFNKVGISLPHNAAAQASLGTHVEKIDLQPFDLVFFSYYGSKGINHVGIYFGEGKFIHASTNKGVGYNSLNDAYYLSNYRGARRIL